MPPYTKQIFGAVIYVGVMACGIFLDSNAFMFRVTDPGDEGIAALLNVGNHHRHGVTSQKI
jgi:hypothetical protein